jgi:hypothetical protein
MKTVEPAPANEADPDLESRLFDAFAAARNNTQERPDLFARVQRSISEDQARRSWRKRIALRTVLVVIGFVSLAFALSTYENGRIIMSWWLIELLTTLILVSIAMFLGPFIKRFGRSYAADVFRANPQTGKSYLVLTDVAYYLLFTAFILFTMTFEEFDTWKFSRGNQLKHEVARIGGILLIMGFLHAINVVALPAIGRMLTWNREVDSDAQLGPDRHRANQQNHPTTIAIAPTAIPLQVGTWTLRIDHAEPDEKVQDQ